MYKINAQEVSIVFTKDGTYEGCSVHAKEVYKNIMHDNKEKHIKIMLCIDEQQCFDYGFAYLIAHEAMHIKYKDMEYVYSLNKRIENTFLTKYLQAIELRADMTTLDLEDDLVTNAFRKDIITQALYMHVQRLPSVERLKAKPKLWDMCPIESTHPTSLERFAYFTRAQELL